MTDSERHHDYVCAAMASMTQRGLECDHMPADIAQAAKAVADAMMTATGKPDDKEKPKYAHPTKDAVIESLRTQLGRAQRIAMDTERDHDAEIQGLKDQTKDDKKFIEQATNEMAHLRQVVYNCGSPLTHPEREIARLRTVMRQKDLTITLREDELQKAYTKYYDLQHKTDEATAKPDDKDKPVCKWCRGEGQIKTFDQASQLLDIDWCPVCGGSGGAPMEPKPDDKDAEIARLTEANAKALTALKALQETPSGLPYLCDEEDWDEAMTLATAAIALLEAK